MIELDTLLHGNPTREQVQEFFREGEFCQEHYLVAAIKKHLRTPAQKVILDRLDLSIEECLNGRYGDRPDAVSGKTQEILIAEMYADWNRRLGHKHFNG